VSDRLDEYKIDQLRSWGTGLTASGNDDLRATGKAILMLIEEIERLHIDLWTAKAAQAHQVAEQADADVQVHEGTGRSLRVRLTGILGHE
jgi:hypothetical protein